MKNHSDSSDQLDALQKKLAGFGEASLRKTYYPELQQRLEELRESEEFLKNIVDNIPAIVFVKDAKELRYVAINKLEKSCWATHGKNFWAKMTEIFFLKSRQHSSPARTGKCLLGKPATLIFRKNLS